MWKLRPGGTMTREALHDLVWSRPLSRAAPDLNLFQPLEGDPGVQPELVAESQPRIAVCGKCLFLPSSPIEGQHQQFTQTLPVRLTADRGAQLRNRLGKQTSVNQRCRSLFDGRVATLREHGVPRGVKRQ